MKQQNSKRTTSYPTDLTDGQWKIHAPLIPPPKTGGRKRTANIREILNAIFYLCKNWLPMAYASKRLPSMDYSVSLFSCMEKGWDMEKDT